MHEADPSAGRPVEAYLATQALVEPILISRFRSCNLHFYDTDVADCRDKILDRLERRLAEPMEFKVKLAPLHEERMEAISLASSAIHAAFVFELDADPASRGYIVRLLTAGRQIWAGEYPDGQYDSRTSTLSVQVPAGHLRHGEFYVLELRSAVKEDLVAAREFHIVRVEALHLLRVASYSIVGSHADFAPSVKYRAVFHDAGSGAEVVDLINLPCPEGGRLPIDVAYGQLGHEQDVRLSVSAHGADRAPTYFACIRAVRHESLKSRRGFVARMARNIAHEYALRKTPEESLEGLPIEEIPARGAQEAEGRVATLLAKSAVERLPERTRAMLLEHEIEGRSWAEIARTYGISEAKAKQDVSRALTKVSEVVLAGESEAARGAVQRVVDWIKGTLVDFVPVRHNKEKDNVH
jgi:RNA polymerase sigma factor (sigma-70 family)